MIKIPLTLTLCSATLYQPEWARCLASWQHSVLIVPNMEIMDAYHAALRKTTSDILGYVHDDVICLDCNWRERVLNEFDDPYVDLVGVAGATQHGEKRMYLEPFHIPNMVRVDFRSNMVNAEAHGTRLTGSMNAVVLDGMAFFVRRSLLDSISWPFDTPINYFLYMEWLCCMARRLKRKIRVVGVSIEHLGGRTSGMNPNFKPQYEEEHRFLYESFRDVLPARVEP